MADIPIASCMYDSGLLINGKIVTKKDAIKIIAYELYFLYNDSRIRYTEIKQISCFNNLSSTNVIYREHSSSVRFITLIGGDTLGGITSSQWFKSKNVSNAQFVSEILRSKSFSQRLNYALSAIKNNGFYIIPLEPWAVLSENASLDQWREAKQLAEPPIEKQIRITKDGHLERGDGYRVNISQAANMGKLWIGTRNETRGAVNFYSFSPDEIVASNEEISRHTKDKIRFTLSYDTDVVKSIMNWFASNKNPG